jgi:hypothetical protein
MLEIKNYESLEEALMFCIRASNKEMKEVAGALWPSDRLETSYPRLVDALNPSKRQKLSMDEIIFIMNFCNRYDPLFYMADRCLFERPTQRCIEAEKVDLTVRFEEMLEQASKSYQQILKMTKQRDEIETIRKGTVSFIDFERKSG